MMGKMIPYSNVPFFWTVNYNYSSFMQYVGHATEWDEVHIVGDVSTKRFQAFYIKNDKIDAVATMNRSDAEYYDGTIWLEAMKQGIMPSGADIKSGKESVETVKEKLRASSKGGICNRSDCCAKKPVA